MYSFIEIRGTRFFLRQEAPALVAAFLVAEMFYKFGSFALECIAFLATWFVFSFAASKLSILVNGKGREEPPGGSAR